MTTDTTTTQLNELIDMIGSIARLDFSKRLNVEISEDPVNVIAYGLNMLSEELEANVVKKELLEETNATLERFSYTVAHDIRSPFNTALGVISLMEMELEGQNNEAINQYIAILKSLHERISNMVNGILEYSRTGFNERQVNELDIAVICNDIAHEHQLGPNLEILFEQSLSKVRYNEIALKQVFRNLIDNAIKYNDKDVCILRVGCLDKGTHYELSIADNGPGMDSKYLDMVFDLFENFKSDRTDSFGIGLSIVKKIITQANGTIGVKSTAGQGTTFTFTIIK